MPDIIAVLRSADMQGCIDLQEAATTRMLAALSKLVFLIQEADLDSMQNLNYTQAHIYKVKDLCDQISQHETVRTAALAIRNEKARKELAELLAERNND